MFIVGDIHRRDTLKSIEPVIWTMVAKMSFQIWAFLPLFFMQLLIVTLLGTQKNDLIVVLYRFSLSMMRPFLKILEKEKTIEKIIGEPVCLDPTRLLL